jgi:hypothetical protein
VMQCPGGAGSSFFNYKGLKNNNQGWQGWSKCTIILYPIIQSTCTY